MSFHYDPDAFWTAHGPYLARESVGPAHLAQEAILRELLHEIRPIHSVIDVGCGQGRLAAVLRQELPHANYTGMDLGQAQLDGTKRVRPDGTFILSKLQDYSPDRQWDLALASEVLLHIPPTDIQRACDNLKQMAGKWLLTIDWTRKLSVKTAEWNWLYDYESLMGKAFKKIPSGDQTVFLWQM